MKWKTGALALLVLGCAMIAESSNAICRKNEYGDVELRIDDRVDDNRQTVVELADGSTIDSIDKRCFIKTRGGDRTAKVVYYEGYHGTDDNSALTLKDGSHIVFGQRSPRYAPYQRYIRIFKFSATGELIEPFGTKGVVEIFPGISGAGGNHNLYSGHANKAVLSSYKELSKGRIELIWSSCFQSTFSYSGGCEGSFRMVLSNSGIILSRRPYTPPPPPVLPKRGTETLTDNSGNVLLLSQADALKACPKGTHLPSIREMLKFAGATGIRETSTIDVVKDSNRKMDLISTVDTAQKNDQFFYDMYTEFRKEWETDFKNFNYWTSSTYSEDPSHAYVFHGWRSWALTRNKSEPNAVICLKNR